MEILKKYWKFILAYGLLLIVFILILYFYREVYESVREMIRFFSSRRRLNAFVASYGAFAPLIFICLQCLQVLFAPIPGELTGFIGGFLFGILPGVIYSTIGLTLGSFFAFSIARRFGMPFIRKFVGQELMAKFDYLMEHKGAFFSFIFLLIPGTPKDYFCYILGLSPMHVVTFMIISTVGRFPGTVLLTMQGQAVQSEDYRAFFVFLGLALLAIVVAFVYRDRIERWLKHKKPHPDKKGSSSHHRSKNKPSSP
jgi:uncharacterized membrane protein YdjX (TVP38/TMEM64 family)